MVWKSSNNSPLSTSSCGTSGTIFRILTLLGTSLFFLLYCLVMGETVLFTAILKERANNPHTNPEANPRTATLKQQLLIWNNCYSTKKALQNVSLKVWNEASEVAFKYPPQF
jgi:hypothetical protein